MAQKHPADGPPPPRSAAWRYLRVLTATALLPVIAVTTVNYLIDPFQFFRRAERPQFSQLMMRHQAPGVIRHYPFDAILVGNSRGANFMPHMFRNHQPPIALQNLAMWGGTTNEAALVARAALRHRSLKTVFWIVGYQPLVEDYRLPGFPTCLYSSVLENVPYCYLLNIDILRESIAVLLGASGLSRAKWTSDLAQWQTYGDVPIALHEHACMLQRLIGSPDAIEAKTRAVAQTLAPEHSIFSERFEQLVLPIVDAHPELRFVFIVPAIFATEYWYTAYYRGQALHSEIKRLLLARRNVEVFDFQTYSGITHDPRYFRDVDHPTKDAMAQIAHSLGEGRYRVTDLATNIADLQNELVSTIPLLHAYFDERC